MKICRFEHRGTRRWGIIDGETVRPVGAEMDFASPPAGLVAGNGVPLAEVRLLAPAAPSKIVCVGRNYAEHAAELGNEVPKEPLLFLKAPSSLIGPDEPVRLPAQSSQVEHEGELAVVIGRECSRLGEGDDPLAHVFGYTCLNDVTARDLQRRDVQFTRAKSFDTFCPVGPWIETDAPAGDPTLTCSVNGVVMQIGRASQMVFPVATLITYISNQMTLLPGDIVATGTPSGVSKLSPGDVCEVSAEGIGTLSNPVV